MAALIATTAAGGTSGKRRAAADGASSAPHLQLSPRVLAIGAFGVSEYRNLPSLLPCSSLEIHVAPVGGEFIITLRLAFGHADVNGVDYALGSRFLGSAVNLPPARRLLLKAATWLTRITSGLSLTDTHNGLRAMTRRENR